MQFLRFISLEIFPMEIKILLLFHLFLFQISIIAQSDRIPVTRDRGFVVSSHFLASETGFDILRKGGMALVAFIAIAFMPAVTHPSSNNFGDDRF